MSKAGSKNPAYPDAHPTAPGGMSQQALADELRDKHGWDEQRVDQFRTKGGAWNLKMWTKMIDAVARERKAAEDAQRCEPHEIVNCAVCSGEAAAFEESLDEPDPFADAEDNDILAELDALLDEADDAADSTESADARSSMFAEPDEADDDFDPDDLMSELITAREDAEHEPIQYGLLTKDRETLDYIFDGHAGAGPSASERWMHCTMSLGLSRAFLETLTPHQQEQFSVANVAARQGTTAHAAAEVEARMVLGEADQEEVDMTLLELAINPATEGEAYDDEMAEYITEYTDLVRTYAQDRGNDHVLIEARVTAAVPLVAAHDGAVYEVTGSGDCIVLPTPDDPTLVVADLKYGEGIDVDVDENPQVRIYGLGALGLLVDDEGNLITDVETVTYHIVQPRLGGIKTWSEPLDDLLQWRDEVLAPALTAALYGPSEGAEFNPSETACQFCPARGTCPALAAQRIEQADELFGTIVDAEFADGPGAFPETAGMTDDVLGSLLAQVSGLIDIHKDLKAEAERRLFRGGRVPGFQLVNYSPPRKWHDGAADVIAAGEVEGLTARQRKALWREPALVTPTQAQKILGDEDYTKIASLVDKPDKRPVIAREGDRRKTWEGKPPEAMFDVEEES